MVIPIPPASANVDALSHPYLTKWAHIWSYSWCGIIEVSFPRNRINPHGRRLLTFMAEIFNLFQLLAH